MGLAQTPIDNFDENGNLVVRENHDFTSIRRTRRNATEAIPNRSINCNQTIESYPEDGGVLSDDTDIEEEMMQIKPSRRPWISSLEVGDLVDAQNAFGNWCHSRITSIIDKGIFVEFLNMNSSWKRWVPFDSSQMDIAGSHSRMNASPLLTNQVIEVRQNSEDWHANAEYNEQNWKEAMVIEVQQDQVHVQYVEYPRKTDWIPLDPSRIAPIGQHICHRRLPQGRISKVQPSNLRRRMIKAQNPTFLHYRSALMQKGLSIYAVNGDGNCLFRSVSHQIYGDDRHHALIRRYCMDYMESETEYFEPYVVGGVAEFQAYLQNKRRDGVWGDDPEIQAICELYDRPAEIFAYDSSRGFCKLRTFHENSSLTRNRPSIRLSYYGGGHYDSVVGSDHTVNLIREAPGVWEQIHLDYSRSIVRRRQSTVSDQDIAMDQYLQQSDRECTEMEELQHILQLSRNEFDAMNSNLDDSLKHKLECQMKENSHHERFLIDEKDALNSVQIQRDHNDGDMQRAVDASRKEQSVISDKLGAHGIEKLSDSQKAPDTDLEAAIKASLVDYQHATDIKDGDLVLLDGCDSDLSKYDDHMKLAFELSVKEYESERAAILAANPKVLVDDQDAANIDELDELQRAIQASLREAGS